MPPRYGVAWLRLPCENRTEICCRGAQLEVDLAGDVVVVEPDRQAASEIVVLQPGVRGIGQEDWKFFEIGEIRSCGMMLPGNGSRTKPVPFGFGRVVRGS